MEAIILLRGLEAQSNGTNGTNATKPAGVARPFWKTCENVQVR